MSIVQGSNQATLLYGRCREVDEHYCRLRSRVAARGWSSLGYQVPVLDHRGVPFPRKSGGGGFSLCLLLRGVHIYMRTSVVSPPNKVKDSEKGESRLISTMGSNLLLTHSLTWRDQSLRSQPTALLHFFTNEAGTTDIGDALVPASTIGSWICGRKTSSKSNRTAN